MNMLQYTLLPLLALGLTGCFGTKSPLFGAGSDGQVRQEKQYDHPAMLDPSKATERAPDSFRVKFQTTKGDFVVQVNRDWAPNGADRFYNLVKIGYFDDVVFFRCIQGFMCQFGIHGDPAVNAVWSDAKIPDDEQKEGVSNREGYLTFARTGAPNSRSVQFFINMGNNSRLDSMGFTPIGRIVEGMDNFLKLNTEYGENDREDQGNFQQRGNAYILGKYPNLDRIIRATILDE